MNQRQPFYLLSLSVFVLSLLILGAVADDGLESAIEASRPKVLLHEDFESYQLGERRIEGTAVAFPEGSENSNTAEVDALADEEGVGSKQLVVRGGGLSWETARLTLEEPILTNISVDLTVQAGPEGFAPEDRVHVYARLGFGQIVFEPLFDFKPAELFEANTTTTLKGHIPMGALTEKRWDNDHITNVTEQGVSRGGFVGVLGPPKFLRVVIQVESARSSNAIGIDNVLVQQSPTTVDAERWKPENLERLWFQTYDLIPARDYNAPLQVCRAFYKAEELAIDIETLATGSFCIGTLSPLEEQVFIPVRNVQFVENAGFDRNAIQFTIDQPENGWRSLSSHPGLYLCEDGEAPRPIDRFRRTGTWFIAPWPQEEQSVRITVEDAPVIQGNERFVDFTLKVTSVAPWPTEDLDQVPVWAEMGSLGGENVPAEYLGLQGVEEGGTVLRMAYRLRRPAYGWPPQLISIEVGGLLGERRLGGSFLRVAYGRDAVGIEFPASKEVPPDEVGAPEEFPQFVRVSDETFTVEIDYVSEFGINVRSIGDGDVLLQEQAGNLISTEALEDGNRVRATFQFDRDPQTLQESLLPLRFPNGGVRDKRWNTTFGYSFGQIIWQPRVWRPTEDTLEATLLASELLEPTLESYRFTVSYESAGAALNDRDFQETHLLLLGESLRIGSRAKLEEPDFRTETGQVLRPTLLALQRDQDGRRALASYRVDKPAAGWPVAFKVQLLDAALRDVDGAALLGGDLGSVSRSDLNAVDLAIVGGLLIEGDPDVHRVNALAQIRGQWQETFPDPGPFSKRDFGSFDGAKIYVGGIEPVLSTLKVPSDPAPARGELTAIRQIGYKWASPALDFEQEKLMLNFEIQRPPGGWDTWQQASLPFFIMAPSVKNVPGQLIASGKLILANDEEPLPLLFGFEEWRQRLERQLELPAESLKGDVDGDGHDGLTEFILGSDPLDRQNYHSIQADVLEQEEGRYVTLQFALRASALGTAELQHSLDGKTWASIDDAFEVEERQVQDDGIEQLRLKSKQPWTEHMGLFRIAIAP